MANICDVRMRIVGNDPKSIYNFVKAVRNADFRAYNGIFTTGDELDVGDIKSEGGLFYHDTAFGCKWSFVSSFEEDGVGFRFGNGKNFDKYLHEFCKEHSVGIEAYSEEGGNGFEEHYLIKPDGSMAIQECKDMEEHYDDEKDEWWKTGGYGDPDFMSPSEIMAE